MSKKKTPMVLGILSVLVILVCVGIGIRNSVAKPSISGVKQTYKYSGEDIYFHGKTSKNTIVKLYSKEDGTMEYKTTSDKNGKFKIRVNDMYDGTAGKYYLKVTSHGNTTKKNFKVVNNEVGKRYLSYFSSEREASLEDSVYGSSETSTSSSEVNTNDYDSNITYDQLARTPDDYKNKKVALSGTVIQVIEDNGVTEMRLAVNGDSDTVILVDILDSKRGSSHILEDDNLTVYGYSAGTTSYESTMGANITVPYILADKIKY